MILPWQRPEPSEAARGREAQLAEAVGLASAIDLLVVYCAVLPLRALRPSTLLGAGQVEAVQQAVMEHNVAVVVVDAALSPVQQRNLERAFGAKVIDRTGLILEIFGERARTREGALQVELAHLTYQRSRLVRSWTHLERQRGGFGFFGGPGETQIEADRRLIGQRIAWLKRELETVRRTRGLHRAARRAYPVVALVGYTNAGKSTLFNALTGAHVTVADRLFATLDPTMRGLFLPSGRRVILFDTVGFISNLPTELIAAFRATLEEVGEADVILHVRDGAHPDSAAQRADVIAVLDSMARDGLLDPGWRARTIEVVNKIDLVAAPTLPGDAVAVSALTGENLPALTTAIEVQLGCLGDVVEFALPVADGGRIAWLYRHGEVLAREEEAGTVQLKVRLAPAERARFERLA